VDLPNVFASEFDRSGSLAAVVWGIEDPVFREAVLANTLGEVPPNPRLEDAFRVASRLRAQYVLWTKAERAGAVVKGEARLFRSEREVWKDARSITVTVGAETTDLDAARAIIGTWMTLMAEGPLRELQRGNATAPPVVAPADAGQEPPAVTPAPEPVKVDNSRLKSQVAALNQSGRPEEAISVLRDAVDEAPLDLERRLLLLDALSLSDPASAAGLARRIVDLFPDRFELRMTSARLWLAADRPVEARQDLNEAIVRFPNSPDVKVLMAEVALREGKAEDAIDLAGQVIAAQDRADARLIRAVGRAFLGGTDGVQADLEALRKFPDGGEGEARQRFRLTFSLLASAFETFADDMRSFLQRALVRRTSPEVADIHENLSRQIQARIALMTALQATDTFKESYGAMMLGHRMSEQSLLDARGFLTSGDEDVLAESRISLGEAIRQVRAARLAFEKERATSGSGRPATGS
jgi:tetratricopeptide (TPR) repeat protein